MLSRSCLQTNRRNRNFSTGFFCTSSAATYKFISLVDEGRKALHDYSSEYEG